VVGNRNRSELKAGHIQAATEVFSYKWHPAIVYTVYGLQGAGYSEIEAKLDGISSKVLSDGLSDLCERSILSTKETVEGSGRVVYELTDKGRSLIPVLRVLGSWKKRYEETRPSVLIVEDERMVADVISEYFSRSYDVHHFRTGEQVLERYTDDTDLLIVDRKLEGMSGDDVVDRIRKQYGQELILCVSGVEPDDDISDLEVDDYMHKPVEEDEMKTRLELLMSRAELGSAVRKYLSLRSKQIALTDTHGNAAKRMKGYKDCTERIKELNLPSEQKRSLEPLLPSSADESRPFGE
jgi:DNA-binding response OmpR family regulator